VSQGGWKALRYVESRRIDGGAAWRWQAKRRRGEEEESEEVVRKKGGMTERQGVRKAE